MQAHTLLLHNSTGFLDYFIVCNIDLEIFFFLNYRFTFIIIIIFLNLNTDIYFSDGFLYFSDCMRISTVCVSECMMYKNATCKLHVLATWQ